MNKDNPPPVCTGQGDYEREWPPPMSEDGSDCRPRAVLDWYVRVAAPLIVFAFLMNIIVFVIRIVQEWRLQ